MRKQYITAALTAIVLLLQPAEDGKRKIGKLLGKEITVMETLKNRKAVIKYLGR